MAKIHYTSSQWYIRPDESVETIIVNGTNVVFIHYWNGYYSYFLGLEDLMKYVNDGDTSGRFFCSDNTEEFEKIGELFG